MNTEQRTALLWSNRFREHDTGAHPEGSGRVSAIRDAIRSADLLADRDFIEPSPVDEKSLAEVHTADHIELVRDLARRGGGRLDPDTVVSPASYDVALLAAGAACQAVDISFRANKPSFALGRPPGHHAESGRGMGFCLFNNIAIAAKYAQVEHDASRVAIVDWDVHHGNGTQAIFWADPSVHFSSLHRYPFYPGTGARNERGEDEGHGTTLNLPFQAGSTDAQYIEAFTSDVIPAVEAFQPDVLMVSAGFDAHFADPLGGMGLTVDGFSWMAQAVLDLSKQLCEGRLVLVLEGGYNLQALGESVVACINVLDGSESPVEENAI